MQTGKHQTDESRVRVPQPNSVYVVGCPRSGTGYASRIFRAAGYDVGHETMGSFGTSDFRRITHRIPDRVAVVHQVRHPLRCMTSLQTILDSSYRWLVRRIAFSGVDFDPARRVETSARIWLHYNAQCETIADVTYRVESEADWQKACRVVGLPRIDRSTTATDFNSRRDQPQHQSYYEDQVTWEKIEAEAGRHVQRGIQRMARRYGYEL